MSEEDKEKRSVANKRYKRADQRHDNRVTVSLKDRDFKLLQEYCRLTDTNASGSLRQLALLNLPSELKRLRKQKKGVVE